MIQKRQVRTKALSAYFTSRHTSLASALAQVGIADRAYLDGETISEDVVGRIARRFGMTFERLAELAEAHMV